MKRIISIAISLLAVMTVGAKDIKTLVVTTQPQMHCEGCEQKIKGSLRFEKGVKMIETSVERQTVTITYDADKTTAEKLIKAFQKIDYTACPVQEAAQTATPVAPVAVRAGQNAVEAQQVAVEANQAVEARHAVEAQQTVEAQCAPATKTECWEGKEAPTVAVPVAKK